MAWMARAASRSSRSSSRDVRDGGAAARTYAYDLMATSSDSPPHGAGGERARLQEQIDSLERQEADITSRLAEFDQLFAMRRKPIEEQLDRCKQEKAQVILELESFSSHVSEPSPEPPGPEELSWVDSTWFGALCNAIVAMNLASMAFGPRFPQYAGCLHILDHVFLAWYVVELSVKYAYHRENLFFGRVSVVWWNWLDLGIVVSGVLDQWMMAAFMSLSGGSGGALPVNTSALRTLRFLRLFRILRFLKLVRAFLQGDLNWTQSAPFEVFMSCVIAVNAIVMSLELDYEWAGWVWVENMFLVIYFFELSVRIKRDGLHFLVDSDNWMWNYLDSIIVLVGVFDLWLMPAVRLFRTAVLGYESSSHNKANGLTSLLRLLRIFRILRLIKLLKTIKPLYRLLLGVVESLKAMQWVIVLTMLMLYGGAIFWTSLVGKGLLYHGHAPAGAEESFGSVPRSLFSLFRLMNGDTDPVSSITQTIAGQLLFVSFMVLSNWAILAILTSVVSDNMIAASQRVNEEDSERQKEEDNKQRVSRLTTLFKEVDTDSSGHISQKEWDSMMMDVGLRRELADATGLQNQELQELFQYLAVDSRRRKPRTYFGEDPDDPLMSGRLRNVTDEDMLPYQDFIEHLKDEDRAADKRSVLRLMSKMEKMELSLDKRLDEIWVAVRGSGGGMPSGALNTSLDFGYRLNGAGGGGQQTPRAGAHYPAAAHPAMSPTPQLSARSPGGLHSNGLGGMRFG